MVIIAYCVVVSQIEEIQKVSLSHVIEAHRDAALVGVLICRRRIRDSPTNGDRDPAEQVELTAAWILWSNVRDRTIGLLPHLIEAVHRIAGVTRVSGVRDGI